MSFNKPRRTVIGGTIDIPVIVWALITKAHSANINISVFRYSMYKVDLLKLVFGQQNPSSNCFLLIIPVKNTKD